LHVDTEGVEDAAGALHSNPVILVPLVARDLRLVCAQAFREIALRNFLEDAQADEHRSQAVEVVQLADIAALEPFIAHNLFLELQVKRAQRIKSALELFTLEAGLLKAGLVVCQSRLFGCESPLRFLILAVATNHGAPPILTIPRGLPSRRDSRN